MFALQVPAWQLEGQARSVLKRGRGGPHSLGHESKHRGPGPALPTAPRSAPASVAGWAQPRCGQCHRKVSAAASPARPQRLTGSALKPTGRLDPSTSTQDPGAPATPGTVPQLPGPREGRPCSERASVPSIHSETLPAVLLLTGGFPAAAGRPGSSGGPGWRAAQQDVCCCRAPCRRKGVLTCGVPPFLRLTHHATLNQLQIKLSRREIICFKHKRFFFSHR